MSQPLPARCPLNEYEGGWATGPDLLARVIVALRMLPKFGETCCRAEPPADLMLPLERRPVVGRVCPTASSRRPVGSRSFHTLTPRGGRLPQHKTSRHKHLTMLNSSAPTPRVEPEPARRSGLRCSSQAKRTTFDENEQANANQHDEHQGALVVRCEKRATVSPAEITFPSHR